MSGIRRQAAQRSVQLERDWLDKTLTALVDGSLELFDDLAVD